MSGVGFPILIFKVRNRKNSYFLDGRQSMSLWQYFDNLICDTYLFNYVTPHRLIVLYGLIINLLKLVFRLAVASLSLILNPLVPRDAHVRFRESWSMCQMTRSCVHVFIVLLFHTRDRFVPPRGYFGKSRVSKLFQTLYAKCNNGKTKTMQFF